MKIFPWVQKYYFYFLIFFFFLTINFLTPPIFDDWEVSAWFINASGDILGTLTRGIFYFWSNMNGRALTNEIMMFFTYFNYLWVLVSAIIFVFITITVNNVQNKNFKFTIPLTFFLFISVSSEIRMETYSYISAHVTYIFAFSLALLFYLKIKETYLQKYSWLTGILFIISSFIIGSWVENLSVGFTACLLFSNLVYWFKTKKLNYLLLLTLFTSCLGLLFLFTSPGMRNVRGLSTQTASLWSIFKTSLPQNINLIIFQNKIIFAILSLLSFLLVRSHKINSKYFIPRAIYLMLLIIVFFILTIPLISQYIFIGFGTLNRIVTTYFFTSNLNSSFFWCFFISSLTFPIFILKSNRFFSYLVYIYAVFSFIPLLFIAQTGNRIIAVPVLSFSLLAILFATQVNVKNIEIRRSIYIALIFAIFLQTANWLYIYSSINKIKTIRESIMKEVVIKQHTQKWDYNIDKVYLPKYINNQVLNNGVVNKGEFHFVSFLNYYHLNPKTSIVFE